MKKILKYWAVAKIHIHSRWTYWWDSLATTFFLAIILFVFSQLWKSAFSADESKSIEGFTLPMMIWYYVGAEVIIMSMLPIHRTFESEIRDGDVAIRLNKPVNYLGFHLSAFLGEAAVRALFLTVIGALTAWLLVGGIEFKTASVPAILVLYFTTMALNFCYGALIGVTAFWTEDITGLYFVMDRAKWLLGGFLLPVALFPEPLKTVAEHAPFQWMIYAPARAAVDFSWELWTRTLWNQALLLVLLGGLLALATSRGLKRLNVNGG